MNDAAELNLTRRYFLGRCTGLSLGAIALSQMTQPTRADEPATARHAIGAWRACRTLHPKRNA